MESRTTSSIASSRMSGHELSGLFPESQLHGYQLHGILSAAIAALQHIQRLSSYTTCRACHFHAFSNRDGSRVLKAVSERTVETRALLAFTCNHDLHLPRHAHCYVRGGSSWKPSQ